MAKRTWSFLLYVYDQKTFTTIQLEKNVLLSEEKRDESGILCRFRAFREK